MRVRNFLPMIGSPVTVHAPRSARKLPTLRVPATHLRRAMPAFQTHASDSPIIVPPASDNPSPMIAVCARCSFDRSGESNATQSGPVLTNTTELATLVYSSEDIHVAKCTARKMPEKTPSMISLRVKRFISSRCFVKAIGASRTVAKPSLRAAITSDGAPSLCANRIKMLAVDTANTAIMIAMGA